MKKLRPQELSEAALEMIANKFKALSGVSRLKIIIALEDGEKNVTTLVEATGLNQANLSRHLQTLVDCGVLSRRKEGLSVYYSICDPTVFKICDQVCGGLAKRIEEQAMAFRTK